jgi:hypothetical protein
MYAMEDEDDGMLGDKVVRGEGLDEFPGVFY